MIVRDYREVPAVPVEGKPGVAMRVVISEGDGAPSFIMRVFELQPDAQTFLHTHWQEHEVFVLAGKGAVRSETGETTIEAGSVVFVAPNESHQFVNRGEEVLRFVCLIPADRHRKD
jgi:quercetin dioxygenase-like cupin family protein